MDISLEVLLPDIEVRLSTGETVTVSPPKFTQIPAAAVHINGLVRAALESGALNEDGDLNLSRIGDMIAAAGEPLFQMIALCTGLTRERLDSLSVEDGLDLSAAVIRANWRPELIKKIQAMAEQITAAVGERPSPDSSGPDTVSTT